MHVSCIQDNVTVEFLYIVYIFNTTAICLYINLLNNLG